MSQFPHIHTLFIVFVLLPLSLFVACNADPNSLEVSDATLVPSPTITQTPLELRAVIEEMAGDLFDCPRWRVGDGGADTAGLWRKYPPH